MRLILLALLLLLPSLTHARVLDVGPGQAYAAPSDAALVVQDGDTVQIAAGEYFDCAIWHASHITIAGSGLDTVLTERVCAGKAVMVIAGQDVTLRDLTLTRARVGDGNGAGIRAEGGDLTIDHVAFINNQTGLLVADNPTAHVVIRHSQFEANGACGARSCVGSLVVGRVAVLDISHTSILATKTGSAITSHAHDTILANDTITDGLNGAASYLIDNESDGRFELRDSVLQKGSGTTNTTTAIHVVGPWLKARIVVLRGNRFTDDSGARAALLRNWTSSEADLQNNTLIGTLTLQTDAGKNLHRLYWLALDTKAALRHLAAMAYHALI